MTREPGAVGRPRNKPGERVVEFHRASHSFCRAEGWGSLWVPRGRISYFYRRCSIRCNYSRSDHCDHGFHLVPLRRPGGRVQCSATMAAEPPARESRVGRAAGLSPADAFRVSIGAVPFVAIASVVTRATTDFTSFHFDVRGAPEGTPPPGSGADVGDRPEIGRVFASACSSRLSRDRIGEAGYVVDRWDCLSA